jgi:glutaredoxin
VEETRVRASRIVWGIVSSLARCKRHSLACGPDGLCVLCRKDARSKPLPIALALIGGALLVVGSAVAYGVKASRAAALEVTLPARPAASTTAPLPLPIAPATDDDGLSAARARAARVALERQRDFQAFQAGLDAVDGAAAAASAVSPESTPDPAPAPAEPPAPVSIEGLRVVVYTTSWCPVCKRAKAWMNGHGIPYEEHDIEASSDDARDNRAINPRGSIPTFDIEGNVMVGFSEGELVATLQRAARMRSLRPY